MSQKENAERCVRYSREISTRKTSKLPFSFVCAPLVLENVDRKNRNTSQEARRRCVVFLLVFCMVHTRY